jgi:hypothetical protein
MARCLSMAVIAAALAATACGANKTKEKEVEKLPICTTNAECDANDGKRVEIVGTYTVWDPLPERKLDHPPAQQVILVLAGEEGPYLEAWGQPQHKRPLDEIARFQGKQVRVKGTYLKTMPPHPKPNPRAADLAGPCIHPIESITLAD